MTNPSLESVLTWLYEQEQNVSISSWDGGWRFTLGDYAYGFIERHEVRDLSFGARWLLDEYLKLHPEQRESAVNAGLI